MSSPTIQFPIEDRDLDDAELWAVIDSAAASRSRKPLLAIKSSNHQFSSRSPRSPSEGEFRASADGEVVQEEQWAQRRPPKMARVGDHRMVVVKSSARAAVVCSPMQSPSPYPLAYSSPGSGKQRGKEVSPLVESPQSPAMDQWRREEKENSTPHSLSGRFPSVSMFKQYQNSAMAILEKTDYTMISGSPYIKKSGWRKISFYFNLSYEIRDKSIEFDENRNVQRAEFVVRAYMQGGRFSDGWGSCERREKRFLKPNHDIPSTAETRAKNRACQDLLGIGEYRPGIKL
ncbi:uncharacterized protein A4U43_C07F2440 [Asparagus officinalis]|uniref:Uncharacterized protein n=1 Tax=Asparagus officinalis TaxID=4686 RepID=A0A5P1E8R0_ASPOF|nr:uncharacterized protein LOC109850820 [Asparagus officinalis]ONK62296.1 uncharacterized protein A4U43_C07F2440 [Asparagus officinalis]